VVENRGVLAKTTEYGYDGNGNQILKYVTIGKGGNVGARFIAPEKQLKEYLTSFDYDPENRLTGISYPTPEIFGKRFRKNNFAYCPLGKRIYKSDSQGESYYFYDGDNILLELGWDKKVLARYTTGLGIDDWISKKVYLGERKGWKTLYYHYDGLGSVTALTDEGGRVIQRYNYTPFGTLVPHGITPPYLAFVKRGWEMFLPAAKTNTITYTGREYEPDSGLYYYRARYYDSRAGRFISVDPLCRLKPGVGGCGGCGGGRTSLGIPVHFHPYTYVGNNPINNIDPLGLAGCTYSITGFELKCDGITCYATSGNNNPDEQWRKDEGPIPEGKWKIGIPHENWAPLTPEPGTKTYGRSGFYIHGWGKTRGCIAIKYNTCRNKIMRLLECTKGGTLTVIR